MPVVQHVVALLDVYNECLRTCLVVHPGHSSTQPAAEYIVLQNRTHSPGDLPAHPCSTPTIVSHCCAAAPAGGATTLLAAHNAARNSHGAGPLSWDDSLAQTALSTASTCDYIFADTEQFSRTPGRLQMMISDGTPEQVSGPWV
jgi:hypothetical protein